MDYSFSRRTIFLFHLDFIDKEEGAVSGSAGVPCGNLVFRHGVYLDEARGAAREGERVAHNPVGVGFGEGGQVAFGHGCPVFAVVRHGNVDAARVVDPTSLFHADVEADFFDGLSVPRSITASMSSV